MEKTLGPPDPPVEAQKHLHGRGEDFYDGGEPTSPWETPPRTWRRRSRIPTLGFESRNTSTDVEKTCCGVLHGSLRRKHLHGRGEDPRIVYQDHILMETPPRTWRRPKKMLFPVSWHRNTSTDVEKTQSHHHQLGRRKETPPRTWRRRKRGRNRHNRAGNTSTDVEKTIGASAHTFWIRKHLHGRGEDSETYGLFSRRPRNTSTDVEKTRHVASLDIEFKKHLHGRGEDVEAKTSTALPSETPPRTWRRPTAWHPCNTR